MGGQFNEIASSLGEEGGIEFNADFISFSKAKLSVALCRSCLKPQCAIAKRQLGAIIPRSTQLNAISVIASIVAGCDLERARQPGSSGEEERLSA